MSIPAPNYTQFPNEVIDAMPKMTDAEWRVVCAICRKTFGWHKLEDQLSLSQLMRLTGLSRPGVSGGITRAIEAGYVSRASYGQSFKYRLNITDPEATASKLDLLAEDPTSKPSLLALVNPVYQLGPQLGNPVTTQKKVKDIVKDKCGLAPILTDFQIQQQAFILSFCTLTGVPEPDHKGKSFGPLWGGPSAEVVKALNGSSLEYLALAVERLRQGKMTISTPKSVVRTIMAIYGERQTQPTTGSELTYV